MSATSNMLLLTGAAGFFGQRFLSSANHQFRHIFATDRRPLPVLPPKHVHFERFDLRDERGYPFQGKPIHTIVHAAAALPSHSSQEIHETDVIALDQLINWSKKNGVSHFIHISSTAVYGPGHTPLISEDGPLQRFDAYNTAKISGEELLKERLNGTSMKLTIVRPKAFAGPGRLGLFAYLYDFALSGKNFPVIGDGNHLYQFLHVDDLVSLILCVIAKPEAADKSVFNVASAISGTVAEMFQAVIDRAGYGKRIIRIPNEVALPVLRVAHAAKISPIYERIARNLQSGSTVSLQAARDRLGFEPKFTGTTALLDGFDWYRETARNGNLRLGNCHNSLWKSQFVSLAKIFF